MEKDQNINEKEKTTEIKDDISEDKNTVPEQNINEKSEKIIELTPEEKIIALEDKVSRTFAEMENQRRRLEKERDDAFNYGGFTLAKETLNLIDNLERSKQILEKDNDLKDSKAFESFKSLSFSRICFDLSKLSIKFKVSFARVKPP